jgi:anti-anti-sigma regulatory factor
MPVAIISQRTDGIRVLTLRGATDAQTASDLSSRLAAAATETLRVIVDLRNVPELDLATGRLLLVSACAIRERGGRVAAIAERGTSTAELLRALSVDDDFDVFNRLDAALSKLAHAADGPVSREVSNVVSIHQLDGPADDKLEMPFPAGLDSLTYREGKILEWRLGFFDSARVSYRVIGQRLRMPEPAVRSLERNALDKLSKGPA